MNDMAVMSQVLLAQMMPGMPGMQGVRGLPGLLEGERDGSGGDAFMQLMMQLLGNSETDAAAVMEQMRRDEEEDGVETAAGMMAEMLFATLPPQLTQLISPEEDAAVTPDILFPRDGLEHPQTNDRADEPKDAAVTPDILSPRDGVERPEAKEQRPLPADDLISFERILTEQPAQAKPTPPAEALQFQSAVQDVRESLRSQPKTQEPAAKEIDIEALQTDVDMKRFLPQTAAAPATDLPEPVPDQDVAEQLRTGILTGLKESKEEFVVKLNPEGLGEITVKLVEEKGKILLNIVASSPQVAKALNQEVAALQDSLRPLQAQVQQIEVAAEILGGTQYGASDQRFENRQQFPGQQNRGRSQGRLSLEAGIGRASASSIQMTYDTGLDAYI